MGGADSLQRTPSVHLRLASTSADRRRLASIACGTVGDPQLWQIFALIDWDVIRADRNLLSVVLNPNSDCEFAAIGASLVFHNKETHGLRRIAANAGNFSGEYRELLDAGPRGPSRETRKHKFVCTLPRSDERKATGRISTESEGS